ncbi:MAG TPA: tetratricopeptide repeat protein [Bryobacteraceae bacterium]|nr:tetratricopeptide repeat protein [Bryobacteraceae bacterium]
MGGIGEPDPLDENQPETSIFDSDGFALAEELLADLGTERFRPQDFDHYHFLAEEPLGRGNVGEVWLAEDTSLNRLVAIKFLLNSPDPDVWAKRETHLLASLNHRYIARIYRSEKLEGGTPWFSMEYVEGEQLDEHLRKSSQTGLERLKIFHSICEGVQYAHSRRVVHGDLKPSNIRVTAQGEPRLVDFGLADVIQSGPALGFTPAYAAPEQFSGTPVGIPRDIYALGAILFELLTGVLPFDASTRTLVEIQDLKTSGLPPERPSAVARSNGRSQQFSNAEWQDLDAICLQAMAADESARYLDVGQLLRDLDHFCECRPLQARHPYSVGYRLAKFLKRNRTPVVAAVLVCLIIAGLIAFFTLRVTAERDRALAEARRTRQVQEFMLDLLSNGDPEAGLSKQASIVTLLDRRAGSLKELASDPETQTEYDSLVGQLYEAQFEYPKAERFLRLAVDKSRALPSGSAAAINAAVQLGLIRGDQAAFQEAETIVREALRRARQYFSPNAIEVANAESALGRVLAESGQYDKAIALLNTLVDRKLDGDRGGAVLAQSLTSLGYALQQSGHAQEAEAVQRRALAFDRNLRGNSHPRVAEDLANIATALSSKGQLAEAEKLYSQAADIMAGWYGEGNTQTLQLKTFAALMALTEGRLADAEELSRDLVPQLERGYGTAVHPNLAVAHDLLGKLALRKGDLAAAEPELRAALNINRKLFPKNDLRTTASESALANVLLKEGKYQAAEDTVRSTVQVMAASPFAKKDESAIVGLMLGEAILKQHRYREAQPLLLESYTILSKSTRKGYAPYVSRSREDLTELYRALHQTDKIAALENAAAAQAPGK